MFYKYLHVLMELDCTNNQVVQNGNFKYNCETCRVACIIVLSNAVATFDNME